MNLKINAQVTPIGVVLAGTITEKETITFRNHIHITRRGILGTHIQHGQLQL